MADLTPATLRPRFWIIGLLAAIGIGTVLVRLSRPAPTDRVLILASPLMSQGRDVGVGLEALLSDCMEVLAGATVTHAPTLPALPDLQRLPPQTRLLRAHSRRQGLQLALSLEWNTAARLLAGKPWSQEEGTLQEPLKAMSQAVHRWPLPMRHRQLDALLPRTPEHFWQLLDGLSIQDDVEATRHLALSQRLVHEEPRCASAWTALGDHLYRSLWVNPEEAGIGLNSRTHRAFQTAVSLVPGHPRATFLWSLMLTDTGNQSLALQRLREATRLRPGVPDFYLGMAYAGRTSGLLEGARRALAHRGRLLGSSTVPTTWFAETTYLYSGDLEAFGQNLHRSGTQQKDASNLFYRGYFALLQGQPKTASDLFRQGREPAMAPAPFRDLCRVYAAYLEGRPGDALRDLAEIDAIRGRLRIPDGEWTFKEAEAYALLGDADRGIDCATRAFVQGFSCAAWYEASPFLARVRAHPRWPSLQRNIRERQAVLEGTFPPAAFGP